MMNYAGKIESINFVSKLLGLIRPTGIKIVFTNGCFDLLHSGHVEFLRYAKSVGNILIVGLDIDLSVRMAKEYQEKKYIRPIRTWWDRAKTLEGLEMIDYIIPYATWGGMPERVLHSIIPNVYVKGGDWDTENTPEGKIVKEWDAKIISCPIIESTSTTEIISRIKNV